MPSPPSPETLHCVFATPGLGTRDADGALEVRAPSVRGGLRYWLRALLAAPLASLAAGDLQSQLADAEGALLGSPSPGRQSRVRLEAFAPALPDGDRARVQVLPHKAQPSQRTRKYAIPPGFPFALRLTGRPDATPAQWAAIRAALDLWFTLGGLGLRARRSFGAVQPTAWQFDAPDDVRAHVHEVATTALAAAAALGPPVPGPLRDTHPTPVPVFYPGTVEVFVGTESLPWGTFPDDDWEPATGFLPDLMEAIHAEYGRKLLSKVLGGIGPRQASPTHVSALALRDGSVIPVFTLFHLNVPGSDWGDVPIGWTNAWAEVAALADAFHATPLPLAAP